MPEQARTIATTRQPTSPSPLKLVPPTDLFDRVEGGGTVLEYAANRNIFMQGQPADSLFYIQQGKVKLSVTSESGKEAIVAILGEGDFIGEGCLADRSRRAETAIAVTDCTLMKIEQSMMARRLHERHDISELFVAHLLSRNIRYKADLVDQLINGSEKRLARLLLVLSHCGHESKTEIVVSGINQETLAQMVGTTRSRVSHFMNNFRKRGLIDYDGEGFSVKSGLRSVVGHESFSW